MFATSSWTQSPYERTVDLAFALVSLVRAVVLTFIAASISLAVFRANPFFFQERRGLNEKRFNVVKIRSVPKAHPDRLGKHDLNEDEHPRWTSFLRNSHLDELPQVLNILGGSMSIVGPRPMIDQVLDELTPEDRRLENSTAQRVDSPPRMVERVALNDFAGHAFMLDLAKAFNRAGLGVAYQYCDTNLSPHGDFDHSGVDVDAISTRRHYVVIDDRFFRPAEVDYLLGDPSKARSVLGWEPSTKFDGLVTSMVDADLLAAGVPH
jgi:hypothetical protein